MRLVWYRNDPTEIPIEKMAIPKLAEYEERGNQMNDAERENMNDFQFVSL